MKDLQFVEGLKNRQVMAPLSLHFSLQQGLSLDEAHYILNQSQTCGAIILGSHAIEGASVAYPNGWELSKTLHSKAWQTLVEACRKRQTRLGIQIYANDPNADLASWQDEDFEKVLLQISQALQLCAENGVEFVEIHGANSFLIHRILSPIFNVRTDRWSVKNGLFLRSLLKVIETVKRAFPQLQIGMRFVPEEMDPGYSFSDFLQLIEWLNASPLSYVHLSTRCWNQMSATGELIVKKVREQLDQTIALIGSGAIYNEEEANCCLQYADLVSCGKSLLLPVATGKVLPVDSVFIATVERQLITDQPTFLGYRLSDLPVIAGPMSTMSATKDGTFSFEEKQLYGKIARHADVIVLGATGISLEAASVPAGNWLANQQTMYSHRGLVQFAQRFKTNHLIVQLYHGGEYAPQLADDKKQALLQLISNTMTQDELCDVIYDVFVQFRQATHLAIQAGFSAVELNLSDPYLLCQWCFTKQRPQVKRQLIQCLIDMIASECKNITGKRVAIGVRFSVSDLTKTLISDSSFSNFLTDLVGKLDYISLNTSDYRLMTSQWGIEKIQKMTKGKIPLLIAGSVRTQKDVERLAYKGVFAMMVRPFIFSDMLNHRQLNSTKGYQITKEDVTSATSLRLPKGLKRTVKENKEWYIDK